MRTIAALTLATALSACSLAPKYVRPEAPAPTSWPTGDAYLLQSEAALPAVSFRDIFRDSRLQALVDQALANNRDLRVAAANVAAARAQVRVQRAQQLPEVLADQLPRPGVPVDVVVPYHRGDLVSRVHEHGDIDHEEHTERGTVLRARVDAQLAAELQAASVA